MSLDIQKEKEKKKTLSNCRREYLGAIVMKTSPRQNLCLLCQTTCFQCSFFKDSRYYSFISGNSIEIFHVQYPLEYSQKYSY